MVRSYQPVQLSRLSPPTSMAWRCGSNANSAHIELARSSFMFGWRLPWMVSTTRAAETWAMFFEQFNAGHDRVVVIVAELIIHAGAVRRRPKASA